jgi:hypothetical protein
MLRRDYPEWSIARDADGGFTAARDDCQTPAVTASSVAVLRVVLHDERVQRVSRPALRT